MYSYFWNLDTASLLVFLNPLELAYEWNSIPFVFKEKCDLGSISFELTIYHVPLIAVDF